MMGYISDPVSVKEQSKSEIRSSTIKNTQGLHPSLLPVYYSPSLLGVNASTVLELASLVSAWRQKAKCGWKFQMVAQSAVEAGWSESRH